MRELPPVTARRADTIEEHHGEVVSDPYRWLEDTWSEETAAFVLAENARTEAFLAAVPERDEIGRRLEQLWDFPKLGLPFERRGRWFQQRNSGLQNQAVLYLLDSPESEGKTLLDPNLLAADGTVALSSLAVSEDGSLLAYATSSAGSDWMTWRVRDVSSGADLADVVEWAKYAGASWRHDGTGFYYGAVDPPEPGSELLARAAPLTVRFHRLGSPQSEDELVFAEPGQPENFPEAEVSEDGRYLVISVSTGTAPENRLFVVDLAIPGATPVPLVAEATSEHHYVTNVGETFYLLTDAGAERRRLVAVELSQPQPENWREVLPEGENLLLEARHCGGALVCHHLEHACSRLSVIELDGTARHQVTLPEVCSLVRGDDWRSVSGRPLSPTAHFGLTSFLDPGSIYALDVESGETRLVATTPLAFDPSGFVTEQGFVSASDGATLPLFLTRRADAVPDGETPVLLYGYGGFNVPITPQFRTWWTVFVERGGMLAVAVLRGGGEYGRSWHEAGMLARKQRVFDDFGDCARHLAATGWSRPGRIAVNGASNGGLLVGALLTQQPELVGAAVPEVGVLDLLRFHLFTVGWAWKSDYGDPEDAEQYRWLRSYSPLHNIVPGRCYPPTLVMTGDHDDRVVPGHSFKFAAALQSAVAEGCGPILARVETSAGHGHGKPTSKAIAERADVLAFLQATIAR